MKQSSARYYFFVAAGLLLLAVAASVFLQSRVSEKLQVAHFQKIYLHKEQLLHQRLEQFAGYLEPGISRKELIEKTLKDTRKLQTEDFVILIYQHDSLFYWSNNASTYPMVPDSSIRNSTFLWLGNGYYTAQHIEKDSFRLVGLMLLKHQYPYENRYLKSHFQKDFAFLSGAVLSGTAIEGYRSYFIHDSKNIQLFAINIPHGISVDSFLMRFAAWLYAAFFVALALYFRKLLYQAASEKKKWYIIAVFFLTGGFLRFAMLWWRWPEVLYKTDLFSPAHFAAGHALPSLGDLLLNALFVFTLVYFIYRHISGIFNPGRLGRVGFLFSLFFFLCFQGSVIFLHSLFISLVIDSDISFEVRNVLDLTANTFVGLFSIALLFTSVGLLFRRFAEQVARILPVWTFLLAGLCALALPVFAGIFFQLKGFVYLTIFCLIFSLGIAFIMYCKNQQYNFSFFVFLMVLFSLYSTILTDRTNRLKESERGKVLAMHLATEHDPVAEFMLGEVSASLASDTVVERMLGAAEFHYDELYNYIQRRYFHGYWARYDFQLTVCDADDSLLIQPENHITHCYTFFDDLVNNYGFPISEDGFYYLNYRNGRISYFGRFSYHPLQARRPVDIFLQLDSRQILEAPGYPELLLDEKNSSPLSIRGYAYAKYYKGQLITQSGSFLYSLSDSAFRNREEFSEKTFEGYHHLVFQSGNDNLIVLSWPEITPFERIIAFSYIFVFYFLAATLFLFFTHMRVFEAAFKNSFRNRIQYSMIFMLLLSLLMLGGGSVYFSIRQYHRKYREIITEKMQSVYFEMYRYLQREEHLSRDWHYMDYNNLDELLRDLSNVFYCDINLYNQQGVLLATSRPEIFSKNLTGHLLHPVALREMYVNQKAEYVHREKIGNLTYFSAYVPLQNHKGKFLAYLNLPYFTRQNQLTADVSNLIVTFVNIYLILILISVTLAVILSRQITLPLRMIQARLAGVKLGENSEPIEYPGKDEIASLVKEYNRMLGELEKSAALLARSEREAAWREMARQVAHEIKNPLTPMKLSIQHLKRAWDDQAPQFGDLLKRITATLSEQIDNLSYIATSFSSFASIPKGKFERINLAEILRSTLLLFEESETGVVRLELNGIEEAWVRADKEQMSRVLINLIKNALQAIPADRQGMIVVELRKTEKTYRIMVADNGMGVPEQLREKLFQPNFTTKSAGMGLGLAITKRIIENIDGRIWFETQTGKGTQFYILLPAWEETSDDLSWGN